MTLNGVVGVFIFCGAFVSHDFSRAVRSTPMYGAFKPVRVLRARQTCCPVARLKLSLALVMHSRGG